VCNYPLYGVDVITEFGIRLMPRILIIDDQKDVSAMIAMVLRVNHYEVVEVASGAAGLKAFEETGFDAAIVDIFLTDCNGFDVIAAMRARIADFPIVATSGMTALDFVNESADLPNIVCLQKPFRPKDLLRAVRSAQTGTVRPAGVRAQRAAV
jgi:DNA-binding response OmpR family regulator